MFVCSAVGWLVLIIEITTKQNLFSTEQKNDLFSKLSASISQTNGLQELISFISSKLRTHFKLKRESLQWDSILKSLVKLSKKSKCIYCSIKYRIMALWSFFWTAISVIWSLYGQIQRSLYWNFCRSNQVKSSKLSWTCCPCISLQLHNKSLVPWCDTACFYKCMKFRPTNNNQHWVRYTSYRYIRLLLDSQNWLIQSCWLVVHYITVLILMGYCFYGNSSFTGI